MQWEIISGGSEKVAGVGTCLFGQFAQNWEHSISEGWPLPVAKPFDRRI
jgi:hypothetical protein